MSGLLLHAAPFDPCYVGAYQIDPQLPRGFCAIVDITATGNGDCTYVNSLFKDMNFIVKVHSGRLTGRRLEKISTSSRVWITQTSTVLWEL